MNKSEEHRFGGTYFVFSFILFILVLGYTASVLYINAFDDTIIWISLLFAAFVFTVGAAWIWTLKTKIASIVKAVDDMVDRAIHGQATASDYVETNLSSLENKLIRYIDLSTTHERKLEAEKNKIKALISDISHQTKTPLSNIMLYSQLLRENPKLDEEAGQLADSVNAQSEKLNWLIQSLIKMSRLETGIISIHQTPKPVIRTISEAVSQIYDLSKQQGIGITIDCNRKIAAVHDLKWTSEALFNILENAVKYSGPGGKIHISAEAYEMFARVDISDTGIGIEEGELNLIFKRFYRCKRTAEYEGVGIGLFLAREIVALQGGYIKVSSKVGEGSVFSVYLPAASGQM
ncbi:sensor histidine kinase [Paenibacillus beijingensis]|uniref:histidine kinase n=1 Tax=Paenibacillus beijingensis TaxID=1126833 RepID=A0A0D5NIQ7_9BACL|nr:HAMP domain-containing sensor histidine kinase [Paenibacillus beijingensis]AJY75005.1 histidine kinase [Paenibacillus beijingensis]